jgi:hypothetical protein
MEIVKDQILKGRKVFVSKNGKVIGQGRRTIKDGSKFTHLIKIEDVKYTSSLTYGNVNDTVHMMNDIIEKYHYQVADLALFLKKDTESATCKSIWDFVFNHIQYKRDLVEREQLSSPARLWLNREKEGTPSDCDEHAIMCGSLLYCLGIPFKIRIAGYDGKPFSHVYVVTQSDICIDTVLHAFDKEAFYTSKQDSKIMQIEFLHGTETEEDLGALGVIDTLKKYADDYDNQTGDFVDADRLDNVDPQALNGVQDAMQQEENALKTLAKGQMKATLEAYESEPKLYEAKGFTPAYWVLFRKAYNALEAGESLDGIIVNMGSGAKWERDNLNPVNGVENEYGETVGYLGALEGWFKKIRKSFKKAAKWAKKTAKKGLKAVKKFSKWAVKQLKKIGKFLMKINPICIIVRAILLKKIKANSKNMAIKMGYGLLTMDQAKAIGLTSHEWGYAKRAYAKFAKKFSFFGGSTSKLNSTLKKAWYKHTTKKGLRNIKLHGVEEDLELGQLEGRRSRRRRRRRKAKAAKRAAAIRAKRKAAGDKRKYDSSVKEYAADKRENAAAANKLKNRSRWDKEKLAFLKQIFPKQSKGINGLGVVAAASTGAAAGIVAKVVAWLLKALKKVGLGKVVEKLKEKHIEKLKAKIIEAPTELAKKALEKRLVKAKTNLAIFNSYGNKPKVADQRHPQSTVALKPIPVHKTVPTAIKPLTDGSSQTKTAGMGKVGMIAMVLVAGGLLYGANKKKDKTKK